LSITLQINAIASQKSCGDFSNAFADMHDGDVKNVTVTEEGFITLSQSSPVAWEVKTRIDLETCVALIDFSNSTKPAKPPVPLNARVMQSSVGTLLFEFTDPSGTLNKDKTYPLNIWTTEKELPAADACTTFGPISFQDMHDGDVKTVSLGKDLVLRMGQEGIWNLTTPVDPKTCKATVDFSKSTKPAKPPVPLEVSVSVASGNDQIKRFMMTYTDPSGTLNKIKTFPLNIWESVTEPSPTPTPTPGSGSDSWLSLSFWTHHPAIVGIVVLILLSGAVICWKCNAKKDEPLDFDASPYQQVKDELI